MNDLHSSIRRHTVNGGLQPSFDLLLSLSKLKGAEFAGRSSLDPAIRPPPPSAIFVAQAGHGLQPALTVEAGGRAAGKAVLTACPSARPPAHSADRIIGTGKGWGKGTATAILLTSTRRASVFPHRMLLLHGLAVYGFPHPPPPPPANERKSARGVNGCLWRPGLEGQGQRGLSLFHPLVLNSEPALVEIYTIVRDITIPLTPHRTC